MVFPKVMQKTLIFVLYVLFYSGIVVPVMAAQNVKNKGQPLEISADESLEWHRSEQFFQANKNVHVKQGDTSLRASVVKALYDEGAGKKGMDVHTLKASGGVRIETASSKASGDAASYDVRKGYAVMTGKNLRLESPDHVVTAQDRFEYWTEKGLLAAIGRAKAVHEGDTLEAARIEAVFTNDAQGKRVLKTLEATGDVVITTQTEVLTGAHALYTAATNMAEITGGVRVTRGQNVLEGERAEVDLNTNISKMFGASRSAGGNGRVRGVFYPDSENGILDKGGDAPAGN